MRTIKLMASNEYISLIVGIHEPEHLLASPPLIGLPSSLKVRSVNIQQHSRGRRQVIGGYLIGRPLSLRRTICTACLSWLRSCECGRTRLLFFARSISIPHSPEINLKIKETRRAGDHLSAKPS